MLDIINTYGLIIGIIAGAAGVLLNFLNRDRYKAQVNIYQPENQELRAINMRKTADLADYERQNAVLKAQIAEKELQVKELRGLNSRQPDFENIMRILSNNHKEVILKLTELGSTIAKEVSKHE